jgi:hypothetical protein
MKTTYLLNIYMKTTIYVMGRKKNNYTKKCITCENEFNPGKHKETLNCSKECFKIYSEKTKSLRMAATFKAIKKKYGVNHPSQIEGFSNKVKKTKLDRYGNENYNNRKQAEKTCDKKYGVKNTMKIEDNVLKSKETKLKKYGDENYNNRNKAEKTCNEKYGVDHHMKNKESLDKMIKTNNKKYNVDFPILLDKNKNKLKELNQEKYGSNFYFSSDKHLSEVKNKKIEQLKKILDENNLVFDEKKYVKSRQKDKNSTKYIYYEITCKNCNNTFDSTLKNTAPICRACYPIAINSKIEMEVREFIKSQGIIFESNNKGLIKPFEIDIYIPDMKLAFEINGNYFHSEIGGDKDKYYHISKSKLCKEKNIKLIHIFEDEWITKRDIVKNKLLQIFEKTIDKIYARNCEVKEINNDTKNIFLNENHIQGSCIDKYRYGLFYNNELVSVMSFSNLKKSPNNKKEENNFELIRFANKNNINVVGGFSKLLKHFIKEIKPNKIISYADIRWNGLEQKNNVYAKNEFEFVGYTQPNYFYLNKKDYLIRLHRFSLKKDILLEMFPEVNPKKSEWQIAMKNGYDRIWDCGLMKFQLIL